MSDEVRTVSSSGCCDGFSSAGVRPEAAAVQQPEAVCLIISSSDVTAHEHNVSQNILTTIVFSILALLAHPVCSYKQFFVATNFS